MAKKIVPFIVFLLIPSLCFPATNFQNNTTNLGYINKLNISSDVAQATRSGITGTVSINILSTDKSFNTTGNIITTGTVAGSSVVATGGNSRIVSTVYGNTISMDSGNRVISSDSTFRVPGVLFISADYDSDTTGKLVYDNAVTGLFDGALSWKDSQRPRYLVDLDMLPISNDYVVAYDSTRDRFYTKADATAAAGSGMTAVTGDIFGTGPGNTTTVITADAVTYAKMQNVSATDQVLGRMTAGAGNVEEITCDAAARAIMNDGTLTGIKTTLGLATTDAVSFATINTEKGATEVYPMNQSVQSTDSVTFANIYDKGLIKNRVVIVGDQSKLSDDDGLYYSLSSDTLFATYLSGDGSAITNIGSNYDTALTFRVKEEGTGTLYKGQAVYISGGSGGLPTVGSADCRTTTKSRVAGIVAGDINKNAAGYVRRGGLVTNVDTRATTNPAVNKYETWTAGEVLFLSQDGCLTHTRPTSGRSVKAAYTLSGSSNTDTLLAYPLENPVWHTSASAESNVLRAGDEVGVQKTSFRNWVNVEVASVDSLGYGTFTKVNTGNGLYELYAMDQNVQTADAVAFATVNTEKGATEVYPMNQPLRTTDTVSFTGVTFVSADSASDATGKLVYDPVITGFSEGAMTWRDAQRSRYLVDLDMSPVSDDYVVAYDATRKRFKTKADSTGTGGGVTALTGDIFGTGPGNTSTVITADAVTYAKMQNVTATDQVLGRMAAGAGDVEEITCDAMARALMNDGTVTGVRTTLGLATTDAVSFATVNTEKGATEVYPMNQSLQTTDAVVFGTVSTDGYIRRTHRHMRFTIIDPLETYSADHKVCIDPVTGAKLKINSYNVYLNADPTTEVFARLRYSNTFLDLSNPTTIKEIRTYAGLSSDSAIATSDVPVGKCLYLSIDAAPDQTTSQMAADIVYEYL